MAVTEQPRDFSDLYTLLINSVRGDTSGTATVSQAKRAVNMALYDMHLGLDYKLPWAERRGVLITQVPYTTGTVTTTQGSTTVTGASTLWNTDNSFSVKNARANGKIVFAGSRTPYTVSSVSDDTTIVLTVKFTETALAAETYTYFEDEYALASDFLRLVDLQQFSDVLNIPVISRTEFRRRFPTNDVTGRPTVACLLDYAPSANTTPIRRVRFASPPNAFMQIPYAYITSMLATDSAGTAQANLAANSDEPIVPLRYRAAIFYKALAMFYRDKKDDGRSQEAAGEYTDIMSRIIMDTEVGGVRPKLEPRITSYVRAARRPYSRGGGGRRYDINGRFDRLED